MAQESKPKLLILTSSFPRSREDETCGYVRDYARSLATSFDVRVLTFAEARATDGTEDGFSLVRSTSVLPSRFDPLQAGNDWNELTKSGLFSRPFTALLAGVSLMSFFLRALRLSLRADIICSHWMLPAGFIGALISRLLNKPHIVVEHSGALHLLRRLRGGGSLSRFIVNGSGKIVVVSRDLQKKLTELCPEAQEKIVVMPMGVDVTANMILGPDCTKPSISPAPAKLLFIGRLVDIKGLPVLLRALSRRRDTHLLVAGDGDRRAEMEHLAQELEVKATFLGQVGSVEKKRLYAECDAVVIPSLILPDGRSEGLPVVALEALAAGRPVIASRAGGLSEIVADGQNGFLFEAGNEAMLAEKIELLLRDGELRQRLSAQARLTALPYDWRLVGARHAEIIFVTKGSCTGGWRKRKLSKLSKNRGLQPLK